MPLHLAPPPVLDASADDRVVDLVARRAASEAAVRAIADAPVRYVPDAFLDALQGSWGTPQAVHAVPAAPVRLAVAR